MGCDLGGGAGGGSSAVRLGEIDHILIWLAVDAILKSV